jgi:hypothetical protein
MAIGHFQLPLMHIGPAASLTHSLFPPLIFVLPLFVVNQQNRVNKM